MMKFSVAIVLALMSSASALSIGSSFAGNRGVVTSNRVGGKSALVMEDFGFLKGSGIGFEDLWGENPAISEALLEKELNAQGLRFKMNRTAKEAEEVGALGPDISIGPIELKSPRVASIWEAMGFTATSNNEARQKLKIEAAQKAANDPNGSRTKYLAKYGYPRLVGTGGIFYADQLSTDFKPMGGFGMGKSGVMWPVPEVVKDGTYGGEAGWGKKKMGKK